tara:strand:+ start:1452 stop:1637 length:186 start_codon:yes stop_codon:yes gene_type:complete
VSEREFDGELAVANMLQRAKKTKKQWARVYSTINKPFEYREPTVLEYMLAIQIQTQTGDKK